VQSVQRLRCVGDSIFPSLDPSKRGSDGLVLLSDERAQRRGGGDTTGPGKHALDTRPERVRERERLLSKPRAKGGNQARRPVDGLLEETGRQ
jgi:hypothetical protein